MTRVKGNVVRAWARVAERLGLLAKVQARLSPAALAVLKDPPLAGSWVDSAPLTELFLAVYQELGRATALKLSRETTDEVAPFYTRMLSGLLQIFGTSPASLFGRMNDFSKQMMEGVTYNWKATAERAGIMEVVYPVDYKMIQPQYLTLMSSFEFIFRLCKVKGIVGEPRLLNDHSARFELRW